MTEQTASKHDKVFIDSHNFINWIVENPTGDIEGTRLAIEVMIQLLEESDPMSILVDLSKGHRPNAEQRNIVIQAIKDNFDKIKKIAIFGESPLMKAVAYFILNATGYNHIRFFSIRHLAEAWLHEKN